MSPDIVKHSLVKATQLSQGNSFHCKRVHHIAHGVWGLLDLELTGSSFKKILHINEGLKGIASLTKCHKAPVSSPLKLVRSIAKKSVRALNSL